MRQAEVLAERMALPLKRKLSRRRVYRARGTELDIRRTIRQSLSTSGFPVKRVFRARRTMLPRLVVLHDISHSMAWNNPLLFRFCRGLVRTFDQSEAYAFHTRLFPVSEIYRTRSIDAMRRKLEQDNALGMGGTCIAQSLAEFNEQYLDGTVDSKTIVLIVSDGLDTDSVDALNVQLSRISQRARAVLWLNPMLDREGVGLTRDTLGLRFPHVVGFFPANCLEGLQQSVDEIGRIVQ
jgi:uncharacterized protein with von Willebrand factor type A (vWA) domain